MIFTGPHWAAGVFQLLLAAAEIFLGAKALSENKFAARAAQLLIGVYFLVYKSCEYIIFHKPPVDFSAVSYFFFGLAAILPFRAPKTVSAFCGMIAGSLFIVTFSLMPEAHFDNMATPFLLTMAFFNHNLIFMGMFCVASTVKFRRTDLLWIAGFLVLLIVYAQIMAGRFGFNEAEILTDIVNASVILYIFPQFRLTWWYYVAYYAGAAVLLGCLIAALWRIGGKCYAAEGRGGINIDGSFL